MRSLFDLPWGQIMEMTPRAGLVPPSGYGRGSILKTRRGDYADKQYIYAWDGLHDGGEWEVYRRSDGTHVGVLDPKSGRWHKTKGAVSGRTYREFLVFPVLAKPKSAVVFGPIGLPLGELPTGWRDNFDGPLQPLRSAGDVYLLQRAVRDLGLFLPRGKKVDYIVGSIFDEDELVESLISIVDGL